MILPPSINGERLLADLAALAQIGRDPDGSLNRVAYSVADQAGRAWLAEQMQVLGLRVRADRAGNTIGVYGGAADLPPIGLGSHTDTVPNGGSYDGALGVVAALACVRALHAADQQLRHPVELINFAAEEATMAGGTTGSQAMAGLFDPAMFDKAAWDRSPFRAMPTTPAPRPCIAGRMRWSPRRLSSPSCAIWRSSTRLSGRSAC